jgi:hypothetical protein
MPRSSADMTQRGLIRGPDLDCGTPPEILLQPRTGRHEARARDSPPLDEPRVQRPGGIEGRDETWAGVVHQDDQVLANI